MDQANFMSQYNRNNTVSVDNKGISPLNTSPRLEGSGANASKEMYDYYSMMDASQRGRYPSTKDQNKQPTQATTFSSAANNVNRIREMPFDD